MTEEEKNVGKNESRNDKRWDQLYQLDKKIKLKKNEKIKEKEKEREDKVLEGCTFNPVLYNTNIQVSNENKDLKMIERANLWNAKKDQKLNSLKKNISEKLETECIFQPKLISQKVNYTDPSERKVLNPESYLTYIEKKKKLRNEKEVQMENDKKIPGHGYLWKNQNNLPLKQKFNAALRKTSPKENEIKSLKKPLNLEKFNSVNNHENKSIFSNNFMSLNNEKFDKELEFLEESKKNCIKFDKPMKYENVLKKLHDELHNFEIN